MKPAPISRTTVSVGVAEAEAVSGGFGSYLGADSTQTHEPAVYGRRMSVTLRFSIYSASGSADDCVEVFSAIADALLFDGAGFDVKKLWCDSPRYDKNLDTVVLTAKAVYDTVLTFPVHGGEISDILIRKEGSHL